MVANTARTIAMVISAALKCVRRLTSSRQERTQTHETQRRQSQPQQAAGQSDELEVFIGEVVLDGALGTGTG